jgi:hypothetical protein
LGQRAAGSHEAGAKAGREQALGLGGALIETALGSIH